MKADEANTAQANLRQQFIIKDGYDEIVQYFTRLLIRARYYN
jgi:hypothetical protein